MEISWWGAGARRGLSIVASVCAGALIGSILVAPEAGWAADGSKSEAEKAVSASDVTERDDTVSAQVSARVVGHRVEDLSQRNATTQVFANPDGSWTNESTDAVRFVKDRGDYVPIEDLGTLESAGSTVTGAGTELTVADGNENPGSGPGETSVALATLTKPGQKNDQSLQLGWDGALPEPTVKDNMATFSDEVTVPVETPEEADDTETRREGEGQTDDSVQGEPSDEEQAGESVSADVVVEPTASGFKHEVLVDEVPDGDVVLRFPLGLSKGLKARVVEATGDIQVVDAKGKVVFFAAAPKAWDAKVDKASGLPAAQVDVDTSLVEDDGVQVLRLRVGHEWLASKDREYPVTVDPSWTSGVSDTWVQNDATGSMAGSQELRVGTFNSGALVSRSFLRFSSKAMAGKKITKASLKLYNHYSYSCSSSPVKVQRVTSPWTASQVRWTKQPSATASGESSFNVSKGYSSACKAGPVSVPVTSIMQYWADHPETNYGVRLIAANEKNNLSWHRYRSANYAASASQHPVFSVTYNSYPSTPSGVTFNSGESVKDSSGKLWVRTKTPTLRSTVSDPDGGRVKAEFDVSGTNGYAKKAGSSVASKSVSALKSTGLVDGATYSASAWGSDGSLRSKKAGAKTTFTVDATAPSAPTISASGGLKNNGWLASTPSSNKFTFASSADTSVFQYQQNNGSWKSVKASGGKASLSWSPSGANVLRVKALDRATNTSSVTTWTFGSGAASLTSPTGGTTTSDSFHVVGQGPTGSTGSVTPKVYWREANSVSADSNTFGSTKGWYEAASLSPIAQGSAAKVDTMIDISQAPSGKLKDLGKERVPALVEIQVCFDYAGAPAASKLQCTTNKSKKPIQVTKLPHAFGDNYPTTDVGDGQVALTTGEMNLVDTDVDVTAGDSGLSVSRTYSSLSGLGANSGVFGAGWRANIDGPEDGLAGLMVVESTSLDGTISFIEDDETAAVVRQPGQGRVPLKTGVYTPANQQATDAGWKVVLSGSGASARLKVTESDGTVTVFKRGSVLEDTPGLYEWVPVSVTSSNTPGATRFVTDAETGAVTKIVAGTETNLDCDGAAPAKGCRVLNLSHDTSGKITKVSFTGWDPAKKAMSTVPVAEYTYTGSGANAKLSTVRDSRSGDTTTYSYGSASSAGVPLIASIADKAANGDLVEAPTYYSYGKADGSSRADWLEAVERGKPEDGTGRVQLARMVYGVKPTGDDSSLPDLSKNRTALWEQSGVNAPVTGFAVFGPGKEIKTSKASSVTGKDFRFADLSYVDAENRVVNTAEYAGGAWQVDASVFNQDGLVVRSYDKRATRTLTEKAKDTASVDETGAVIGHTDQAQVNVHFGDTEATAAEISLFVDEDGNGKHEATGTAGDNEAAANKATALMLTGYVTDTYAAVNTDQDGEPARVHTHTDYTPMTEKDAAGTPRMLTLSTVSTQAAAGVIEPSVTSEKVLSKQVLDYDARSEDKDGRSRTDRANLRSGWVNGEATSTTTVMEKSGKSGTTDLVAVTGFDDMGRVIESRQPKSDGKDAGTTTTVYYTAGANSTDSACGNRPEYAGYLCANVPQGAGSVTERQNAFDVFGQVTESTETPSAASGGKGERVTKTTYRADGQVDTTTVTTSAVSGSAALPATKNVYDKAGRKRGTKSLATGEKSEATISWTEDLWGRRTSYTNSLGDKTTSSYDGFGNVIKTVSPVSTSTYRYGAQSGDGAQEYQGAMTSMTVSDHGGDGKSGTYTGSYDGDGNLTAQTMPSGIKQVQDYDETGNLIHLEYQGPITDEDGAQDTGTWFSWDTTRDVTGRITTETSPDSLAPATESDEESGADADSNHSGGADEEEGDALARGKTFDYDQAGRLTKVTDATKGTSTVRDYTFDKNGNRTSLTTSVEGTQEGKRTWAYDAADRVLEVAL